MAYGTLVLAMDTMLLSVDTQGLIEVWVQGWNGMCMFISSRAAYNDTFSVL